MNPLRTISGKWRKKNPDNDDARNSISMLHALNAPQGRTKTARHIYNGNVAQNEIARRRKRNKMARASRKRNRR